MGAEMPVCIRLLRLKSAYSWTLHIPEYAVLYILWGLGLQPQLRQNKYLNNIVEQDHRAIKRIVRPTLGFKSLRCARILIAGIETMHMIRKGQLDCPEGQASAAASQFYSLAF
jgi:transposase-like protein